MFQGVISTIREATPIGQTATNGVRSGMPDFRYGIRDANQAWIAIYVNLAWQC